MKKKILVLFLTIATLSCTKKQDAEQECIDSAKTYFMENVTAEQISLCSFAVSYYRYEEELYFNLVSPNCDGFYTA